MNETERAAGAQKAGDLGAAGILLVSGLAALVLVDEASSLNGGDLIAWILLSLATALLARVLLVHFW